MYHKMFKLNGKNGKISVLRRKKFVGLTPGRSPVQNEALLGGLISSLTSSYVGASKLISWREPEKQVRVVKLRPGFRIQKSRPASLCGCGEFWYREPSVSDQDAFDS